MKFTKKELDQIKYALEYLHDADLSEFGEENILVLENLLDKFGVSYCSQLEGTKIKTNKKPRRKYTGFNDVNNKKIYTGDVIKEGCNGLISVVVWDPKKGTYKLQGLGDYYIEDAPIEWEILKSNYDLCAFFNIPQNGDIMDYATQEAIQDFFKNF